MKNKLEEMTITKSQAKDMIEYLLYLYEQQEDIKINYEIKELERS